MMQGGLTRRNVLVLSAHYPPIRSSQATRAAKMLKHIPSAGWLPTVVCAEGDPVFGVDSRETRDIPEEAVVIRTPVPKWRRTDLPRQLRFPDHLALWIPGAVNAALRLTRRERYDALVSLSFPASSHVAALAVRLATGLPWLADFSDPWMDNPYAGGTRNFWNRPGRILEHEVLRRATRVGFANENLAGFMARQRPWLRPKTVILPNAAERSDFEDLGMILTRPGAFTIVHVGSLYGPRQPTALLEGMARFLRDHPEAQAILRLVGNWRFDERPSVLDEAELRDRVEIVSCVERAQALLEMRTADLLVLIDPPTFDPNIFLPMKLVEYLVAGRPILALAGRGPSERLIAQYRGGVVVRNDDPAGIAEQIARFYATKSGPIPPIRDIPEFEAATVGRKLATVLEDISAQRSAHVPGRS